MPVVLKSSSHASIYIPGFFEAGSVFLTGDPTAGFLLQGTTIHPAGPAVTVSGNTISLGSSGKLLVDGSTKVATTLTVTGQPQPPVTALHTTAGEGVGK